MQMPSSPARHFEYAALAEFSYLFFEKIDHYFTLRFSAPARQFVDTVRGSPRQCEGEPVVFFSHDLALPGNRHEHSKSILKCKKEEAPPARGFQTDLYSVANRSVGRLACWTWGP